MALFIPNRFHFINIGIHILFTIEEEHGYFGDNVIKESSGKNIQ